MSTMSNGGEAKFDVDRLDKDRDDKDVILTVRVLMHGKVNYCSSNIPLFKRTK